MKVKDYLVIGIVVTLLLIAGSLTVMNRTSTSSGPIESAQVTTQNAEPTVLQPFVKGSIAAIEADYEGKPFVIAFWSMYCSHCIQEMETWREIRAKHPEFNLVMVSTDSITEGRRIQAMLAKEGLADVEPWAFADSVTARVRSDIDKTWRGELPRVHFYDSEGQRTVHIGVVSTADMQKWLEES
jgi:thiol-disulfide isomerase/thioredoxin